MSAISNDSERSYILYVCNTLKKRVVFISSSKEERIFHGMVSYPMFYTR